MIKKVFAFSILILLYSQTLISGNINDSLLHKLNTSVENNKQYISQKNNYIQRLKAEANEERISLEERFSRNNKLYREYIKYQADSSLVYLNKNKIIADSLKADHYISEINIHTAFVYSKMGYYVEASKLLQGIDIKKLDNDLLIDYYKVYGYYCDNYGSSNENYHYFEQSSRYRDSLLHLLPHNSFDYKLAFAETKLYNDEIDEAETLLLALLNSVSDNNPEKAKIAYLLGALYKAKKEQDLQLRYYMISAIADIENCIKDNASLQALALYYYDRGNINLANKFMKMAIEDAIFANMRYRASEGLAFYPIINAAYQTEVQRQKEELQIYLILISILSVFFIIAVIYVYKQMQRLSKIRKELYRSNLKLTELNRNMAETNTQLTDLNIQLSESNLIKEEYIAQFFDICSSYIYKLEDFKKTLNNKAKNKQLEELYKILKSNDLVDKEFEELYINFDKIFLNLYPDFISEFNKLLIDEEQVIPKANELLNTELRIFALIRLGITDSVKIASFLRYSLSTIYNYRTKTRNKAAVSRDDFEAMVMKIGKYNS